MDVYKGYKEFTGNASEINEYMENIQPDDFCVNEYLIINNTDTGAESEMRWDGKNFVGLKLPPQKFIKGKNALQRCAIDMLVNPSITICAVLGGYGAGKTYLCFRAAIYNVLEKGRQAKILGVREVVGEGRSVGYLPGDIESKVTPYLTPLIQQLDGGEFEFESLKQRGVIDSNIPYFMKGTTYPDTIVVCDEAEDLTEKQIRLIGTRLGENSRIFICGDYKQSVLKTSGENALIKMCNGLKGHPLFGCVYLGEDVRSETSKLFATLFEN